MGSPLAASLVAVRRRVHAAPAYAAWVLMSSTAWLKPPLVRDEPATLETLISSRLLPTICSAIPPANCPWNFFVFGLDGCGVTSTAETVPLASVSCTPTVSVPLGDL